MHVGVSLQPLWSVLLSPAQGGLPRAGGQVDVEDVGKIRTCYTGAINENHISATRKETQARSSCVCEGAVAVEGWDRAHSDGRTARRRHSVPLRLRRQFVSPSARMRPYRSGQGAREIVLDNFPKLG